MHGYPRHERRSRESGVAEYWIVDPEKRSITTVSAETEDRVCLDRLSWFPDGATAHVRCRGSVQV